MRAVKGKRVSYVPLFVTPIVSALLVFFPVAVYEHGWEIFTINYWIGLEADGYLFLYLLIIGCGVCVCLLPSSLVVFHFQKKEKKDETRVS